MAVRLFHRMSGEPTQVPAPQGNPYGTPASRGEDEPAATVDALDPPLPRSGGATARTGGRKTSDFDGLLARWRGASAMIADS